MSRYETTFAELKARQEGAFVPFVTLCDPNPQQSWRIIQTLIDNGADALELGLPFSDPVADGPVIQRANLRALASGAKMTDCWQLLAKIREYAPTLPVGLLVYANLVYAGGIDSFYRQAAAVGVDSVLIADVPLRESARFSQAAATYQIAPIFIAPPDASPRLLSDIATHSQGYIYVLSRAGVTGTEQRMQTPASSLLASLRESGGAPPLLGFGIAEPAHVAAAIAAGAAGAISGSAVVKRIEQHLADDTTQCQALAEFVQSMKAATRAQA